MRGLGVRPLMIEWTPLLVLSFSLFVWIDDCSNHLRILFCSCVSILLCVHVDACSKLCGSMTDRSILRVNASLPRGGFGHIAAAGHKSLVAALTVFLPSLFMHEVNRRRHVCVLGCAQCPCKMRASAISSFQTQGLPCPGGLLAA